MFNNLAVVMMRRQIVQRNGGFILREEHGERVEERVLVPGRLYHFDDEPALLCIQLRGWHPKRDSWWLAGGFSWPLVRDFPPGALSEAPRCPTLRALVAEFVWMPPRSHDNRTREWCGQTHDSVFYGKTETGWVLQSGGSVPNFAARVVAAAPDPIRDLLREIAQQVDWGNDPLVQRQGALQVRVVYHAPKGAAEMLPRAGSGYRQLYNHYFFLLDRWAWRVIDGTAYALLVPSHGEAYVVSPDHEADWLRLVGELFIARHPLPRNGGAVD